MFAKSSRFSLPVLFGLVLTSAPQVALAAPGGEFDFGPSWKQVLGWGALGLLTWVAVYFVARFIYGVLLDARWSVDFSLSLVIAGTLVTWAAIAAAITLFLYAWPRPWTQYAGYGLMAAFALVLLFGLFGRKR